MGPNLTIEAGDMPEGQTYQVITFHGEFDKAGHNEIRTELDDLVKSFTGKSLIFDFSDLKFINSEGIGYLMEIHTYLIKRDMQLAFVGVVAHINDVFETIGISEIIPLFKDLPEFLNKK